VKRRLAAAASFVLNFRAGRNAGAPQWEVCLGPRRARRLSCQFRLSGLIIGMLLFLVAVGLTLIFGVVNFTHGAFYMFGAYFAMTSYQATGSFVLAIVCGAAGTAILGLIFERVFMSRVYGANVLMQLLVCYAFVLIFDDVVRLVWGPEFKSMGMPAAFQVMPLFIAGGVVPPYYLLLIGVALAAAIVLGVGLARTRLGKVIRAAADNPGMVSALGINTGALYGAVFALGCMLAGLAGALAAPVRSLTPGMGFSVLIESFIVTVIGGMGSISGALIGALLLGLIRSFGSQGFPLFTDGLMYLFMVIVVVARPTGLFGKEVA
jgi:branched-chain amino acid transport system permease protein